MKPKPPSTTTLLASLPQLSLARLGLFAVLTAASVAQASTITSTNSISYYNGAAGNSGTDMGSFATAGNNLTGTITLADNFSAAPSPVDGLQLALNITGTPNSTDYAVTETVTNTSSVTWTGFEIDFGGGNDGTSPAYLLTNDGSTPTTNAPGTPMYTLGGGAAPGYTLSTTDITWSGLSIAGSTSATFHFGIDVASCNCSGDVGLDLAPLVTGATATPEPDSMLLAGLGLALTCAGLFRRRRN